MARLLSFLFALIGGIVVIVLVGSVFLPIVAGILIVWGLLALLSPRRSGEGAETEVPPEPEEDDVPASQAVIDVQAVDVTDEEPDRKNREKR